ncbi:MAG: hypothetical protein RLZZ511_3412 [Cyanobacteriota bacterium]|jgi:hypothetical protein
MRLDLILYAKPGCHLCEGLEEKLRAIPDWPLQIEIRDITTNDDWFDRYQYEIPMLFWRRPDGSESPIPRPSPRATIDQLRQLLQQHLESAP